MADERQRLKRFCPECGSEYEQPDLERCPEDNARLRDLESGDDEDPLVGEVLDDRFEIHSVLGEGGMGRVYIGEQMSVERPVAIKTLRPQVNSEENVAKRFMRESRVISKFSHPNIVNLVDFGRDGKHGILYLVLELVDGVPINELLEQGSLAPSLVVHVIEQLCGGLYAVHAEGIVHRDLKPENVMLVPLSDGRLETKLLDFGIAHALQDTKNLTGTGSVLGTPYYMAPEQAEGRDVAPTADIYSLGLIVIQMLTGRQPVQGDSAMAIMLKHVEGSIPRLAEWSLSEQIPDRLIDLVDTMTLQNPEERPQSMREVREELRAVQSEQGWDDILLDPTEESEQMLEPWLGPTWDPPSEEPTEPTDVSTGNEQAIHETNDQFEADGGTGLDDDSLPMAETMAGVAEQKEGPTGTGTGAPASQDTSRRNAQGEQSSGPTAEVGASASVEESVEFDDSTSIGLGTIAAILIVLTGLLGAVVYVLTPGNEQNAPEGAASAAVASADAGRDDASSPTVASAGQSGTNREMADDAGLAKSSKSDIATDTAGDASAAEEDTDESTDTEPSSDEAKTASGGRPKDDTGGTAAGGPSGTTGSSETGTTSEKETTTESSETTTASDDEPTTDSPEGTDSTSTDAPSEDGEPSDDSTETSDEDDSSSDEASDPGFFPAE